MSADISLDDPELHERVAGLGRQGMGQAEIAVALGLTLEGLRARELADPDLARALRSAGQAREAWWHSRMRELLIERFDLRLYVAEFRWRRPGEPLPWEAPTPPEPPAPPPPRWRRRRSW